MRRMTLCDDSYVTAGQLSLNRYLSRFRVEIGWMNQLSVRELLK
jgi:hypothetical protein